MGLHRTHCRHVHARLCIAKALQRFEHPAPTRAQHSPHAWLKPNYGVPTQLAPEPDAAAPLDKAGITRLQAIVGMLLYYAQAVDSTTLVALGSLASAQANGTEATAKACTHLLNYCVTHPNGIIRYTASGMVLHLHSDASYLSKAKARSRAGGLFFLSSPLSDPRQAPPPTYTPPPTNGALHILQAPSCPWSYHPPPKPNLELLSTMPKMLASFAPH
jgi:hypothetical protein